LVIDRYFTCSGNKGKKMVSCKKPRPTENNPVNPLKRQSNLIKKLINGGGKIHITDTPPSYHIKDQKLMMKGLILLIILVLIITFKSITYGNTGDISECHDQIKPLHLEREQVAELDGMWGLFEKNRELQSNSVIAINLDRKVNSIIFHLEYLCDTLNGIPMNEVARYVHDGINKYGGEDSFRKELIILGKSEADITTWFEFTDFSLKNKERSLRLNTVFESIKNSAPFINSYVSLAKKINRREFDGSIVKNVSELSRKIELFFETDNYMNQALTENKNIPYVDINESSGGS